MPRAYGLPKIHKVGCPFRIIVSSINSPLYNLSKFFHKIIYKSLKLPPSYIKNSYDLVKKLNGRLIDSNYTLASLDIVSLFTNIPTEIATNSIKKRWSFIKNNTNLPIDEFLIGINLILNSTFFTFDNKFYKQIFGTPMGSPLSPIIADIILQDFENVAIECLPFKLSFYYRYVDDILLAAPKDKFEIILHNFNSLHPRLQFTLEMSTDKKINFLDVSLILDNSYISFNLFYKSTFSGRVLNFLSHHPLTHKKGVIMGMVDRVLWLSHPKFHQDNLTKIISILSDNNYPLDFIFSTINDRIKFHTFKHINKENREKKRKFFLIPYIKGISERFSKIAEKYQFRLAFSCNNKLDKFIKTGKDILDSMHHCNVVYKIDCHDCDASYVGQTKRQLRTRIREHKADIKKRSGSPSVISCHKIEHDHEFDWDNATILDSEPSYKKRLISEMVHIKRQNMGLNKQSDTELLPDSYLPLLKKFPKL